MLGEGAADVIGRIADDIIDAVFAAEKVLDAVELRIAAINQIGGNYVITGNTCGIGDTPNSASWILDNPIEPLDLGEILERKAGLIRRRRPNMPRRAIASSWG